MNAPQTIAEIIPRIERAIERVVRAVSAVSTEHMLEPRLDGGRSVKDVLAHLTWWDQWLLVTLPAGQITAPPPITLPLRDQIPPTDDWADAMNAKIYAYNQPRALAHIQAEFTTTRDQLLRRVAELSTDDLYNPDGMAAMIGQPVAPLICGIYEHYEEHAHELEQLRG